MESEVVSAAPQYLSDRPAASAEDMIKGLPPGSEGVETTMRVDPEVQKRISAELLAQKKVAEAHWDKVIKEKNWDSISTPRSCFRFETNLTTDPRRTPEYRKKVLHELGVDTGEGFEHLSPADAAAVIEVVTRKAGAFLAGSH